MSDTPDRYDGPMKTVEQGTGEFALKTEVPDKEKYNEMMNVFCEFLGDEVGLNVTGVYFSYDDMVAAFVAGWVWGKEKRQVFLADHRE